MSLNVDTKIDANRFMEHPKTRPIGIWILVTLGVLILLYLGSAWVFSSNGKDVEIPGLKITTQNKDSTSTNITDNSIHDDHSVRIGTVKGDVITGNKTVNYNTQKDSTSPHRERK